MSGETTAVSDVYVYVFVCLCVAEKISTVLHVTENEWASAQSKLSDGAEIKAIECVEGTHRIAASVYEYALFPADSAIDRITRFKGPILSLRLQKKALSFVRLTHEPCDVCMCRRVFRLLCVSQCMRVVI